MTGSGLGPGPVCLADGHAVAHRGDGPSWDLLPSVIPLNTVTRPAAEGVGRRRQMHPISDGFLLAQGMDSPADACLP
jgi:hypothetical protein